MTKKKKKKKKLPDTVAVFQQQIYPDMGLRTWLAVQGNHLAYRQLEELILHPQIVQLPREGKASEEKIKNSNKKSQLQIYKNKLKQLLDNQFFVLNYVIVPAFLYKVYAVVMRIKLQLPETTD